MLENWLNKPLAQIPVKSYSVRPAFTFFSTPGNLSIVICANGVDCIYFMQDNGKFYIDFEAMSKDQLPYLDTLKQFAKEHNYPIIETTYNNTPIDYDHVKFAPVLSLKVNADIDSIVHVGKLIEQTIFKNNDQTIYDIVP